MDVEPNADDNSDNENRGETPNMGGCELDSEIDFTEESEDESVGEGSHERKSTGGEKRVPSKLVIKAARARRLRRDASNIDKYTNVGGSDSGGKA